MTKGTSHEDVIICASAIPVADANGQPLTRIRVLPIGEIRLKDGRGPFRIEGLAAAQAVISAARAYWGREDMSFDYDHQVLSTKEGKGGRAPASAWIKPARLSAEADGIYANDIEWTPAARAAIVSKEYRYFSPLFGASKTGEVTNLYGGGLTNDPAIGGLTAIAASAFHLNKEPPMDLTALAVSLGLPATATLDQCIAASTALSGQLTALRTTLGIDATGDLIAAASTLKAKTAGDGDIVVSASAFNEMTARLGALESDKIAASVDAAIVAGKVTPALRQWAIDMGAKDPAALASYLAAAPVVAAAANLGAGQDVVDPANGLTADELEAASSAGLTPDEFIAAKTAYPKGA